MSQSPMSITQLVHSETETDPEVQMAAQVLGDMARFSKCITLPHPLSTKERLSFSSDSTIDEEPRQKRQQQNFINRVSNIPIVNSAIKVYENSKNSSYMMKYSAEKVESLVGPIYDKFGKHALLGVDEWGCKQLDKLEERYPNYVAPIVVDEDEDDDDCKSTTFAFSRTTLIDDNEGIRKRRDSREDTYSFKSSRSRNNSTSPHRPYTINNNNRHRQPSLERSKWHQIVMHASSAAGTTAAVISEESMKCLKYCLNWLHYASQHIDQQMNLLKKFLVSLASTHQNSSSSKEIATHDSTLNQIKKEIVNTLRKVVEVVSKYAGQGLPEQAKAAVRGFILALPSRWAILNSSTTASPVASPSLKPTTVQDTSIKLLNFGSESIEMINSVAHIFSDTIDRAELWLNRLRVVGVRSNTDQMDLN